MIMTCTHKNSNQVEFVQVCVCVCQCTDHECNMSECDWVVHIPSSSSAKTAMYSHGSSWSYLCSQLLPMPLSIILISTSTSSTAFSISCFTVSYSTFSFVSFSFSLCFINQGHLVYFVLLQVRLALILLNIPQNARVLAAMNGLYPITSSSSLNPHAVTKEDLFTLYAELRVSSCPSYPYSFSSSSSTSSTNLTHWLWDVLVTPFHWISGMISSCTHVCCTMYVFPSM